MIISFRDYKEIIYCICDKHVVKREHKKSNFSGFIQLTSHPRMLTVFRSGKRSKHELGRQRIIIEEE